MADSSGWCTIESDPAVFTEMVANVGVQGVAMEELISLDVESLDAISGGSSSSSSSGEVYGLILLFKWCKQTGERNLKPDAQNIFFAQQIVQNACATQAILNILLNKKEDIDLGTNLTQFYEFTNGLDAHTRGEMVGQSDVLRQAHNSFARTTVFSFEEQNAKDDDDCYHFVGFIYKDGAIWELDGLQAAPIQHGAATEANWKAELTGTVQKRIQELSALDTKGQGQGISFSLMAVVQDKLPQLELEIAMRQSEDKDCTFVQSQLDDLKDKREKGRVENVRRRHNYIPAVVALLRALAEKGKLAPALEKTKQRTADKRAAKQARKN